MAREINAKIDARAAGGYGHLIRNLPLMETPAAASFLAWFEQLYLTRVGTCRRTLSSTRGKRSGDAGPTRFELMSLENGRGG